MTLMDFPSDILLDEQVALDVVKLRHAPDWERLMEDGTTPELLVGGERRLNPR